MVVRLRYKLPIVIVRVLVCRVRPVASPAGHCQMDFVRVAVGWFRINQSTLERVLVIPFFIYIVGVLRLRYTMRVQIARCVRVGVADVSPTQRPSCVLEDAGRGRCAVPRNTSDRVLLHVVTGEPFQPDCGLRD